jgi:hypothetical protein
MESVAVVVAVVTTWRPRPMRTMAREVESHNWADDVGVAGEHNYYDSHDFDYYY